MSEVNNNLEVAIFGGGCFWCTEAVFSELKGVQSVTSGYIGGKSENPTYEQICTGQSGHAEVIRIEFNPQQISFETLLDIFFQTHDPTTLNRQGADTGTQYRSSIFYNNEQQKDQAEQFIEQLDANNAFASKVVTEVTAATTFYPAEGYHQNYFALNPNQQYCAMLIPPKIDKLKKLFGDKLRG
ncbi:MAG: peptide-methionine (S)-S-oxide reductase [Blastopirellula sp.]|nr:MAG: peptide-methionine (S)-S-oxide reductase [Blastopirellula sp.]